MSSMTPERILIILIELVCIVFSIMVHEIAHGYAAYRLGDPTAKRAGRLTLNPAKHLDPFGSVLLPLIMSFIGGPIFAYAKPVPYNPMYFKDRKKGELIVAFAGPASNLLQAFAGAGLCLVAQHLFSPTMSAGGYEALLWLYRIGYYYCLINLVLLFFNIIPLPPLDGASIVTAFLTPSGMEKFYKVKQYSMFILLALLFLVPMVTPWDPLGWYLQHTAYTVLHVLIP